MLSNFLAALGVALVCVSVGFLTGNVWWALLLVGLILVAAAYVASLYPSTPGDSVEPDPTPEG